MMVEVVNHGFDGLGVFNIQVPIEFIRSDWVTLCVDFAARVRRKRDQSSLSFLECVWATSCAEETRLRTDDVLMDVVCV